MSNSPSIWEVFAIGGGWMWAITLWGIVFYALLIVQIVRRKQVDYTRILWGLLAALALLGPLGTAIGINQAGFALERAAAEMRMEAMFRGVAISIITTGFSFVLSVIGATILGIVSHKTNP